MIFVDLLFSAAFIGVPIMAHRALPYAGVSLSRLSIPSLLVVFYIAVAYAGILPLYFGWDVGRAAMGVVDQELLLLLFGYTTLALILVIAGFVFAYQVIGLRAHSACEGVVKAPLPMERGLFIVLTVVCIGVLILYLNRVPSIAIFLVLKGEIVKAAVSRSQMGNAFEDAYWRYQLFFGPLLTMCCVYFFIDARCSQSRMARVMFVIAVMAATFSSVMAIEKYPFINLIVALYLAHVVLHDRRYVQPALKYVAIVALFLALAIYLAFMGLQDVVTGAEALLSRILTGGIAPAYFYLELFPGTIDFIYGASMPNPGGVLPFQSFPLTMEMMRYIDPQSARLGIVGSAPTVFWAELYANFGFLGVLVFPFVIGLGIYLLQHILQQFVVTPTSLAALILLALHYKELASTGPSSYLFDVRAGAILVVMVVVLASRTFRSPIDTLFGLSEHPK